MMEKQQYCLDNEMKLNIHEIIKDDKRRTFNQLIFSPLMFIPGFYYWFNFGYFAIDSVL